MKCDVEVLTDICNFISEKIQIQELTLDNYISTENMIPNKGGITKSSGLPTISQTQSYMTGDILVSNIRPYFKKIWLADRQGGCSNDVLVFRANEKTIPKFLYYILSSDNFFNYATQTAKGTKMPRGDKIAIMSFSVPDIDLQTQKQIAKILSAIDDKIELNNKINDNLEQQAQAIFKSWFIDFEPFGGVMPSDWEVSTIGKIIEFQNGYAFKSKELLNTYNDDCYHVFKQGHINRGGGFNSSGTKSWYPVSQSLKLDRYVLKKGDVLMAMTDMKDNVAILGNTAIMPINDTYILNQRVALLRSNGYKGTDYPYISLLTNSFDFLKDLRSRANSGVQVNLSSNEIKLSEFYLATEDVNVNFNKLAMPFFEKIINNDIEIQNLAQLRDTLLPKLMSGEIDVSQVEV